MSSASELDTPAATTPTTDKIHTQHINNADTEKTADTVDRGRSDPGFYHDRDYIYINNHAIRKEDFKYAFGGDLNPGLSTSSRSFGNPVPAGLCAFSLACFTLGLIDLQARGVTDPSVLIGACFFSAGIVEGISGIWCLIIENTWGGTVLLCFFGFWMSYGLILCNAFDIQTAYTTDTSGKFGNAMGLFLAAYVLFAFMIWLCTLKSTWMFTILFFDIFFFILLLDIGAFTGNVNVTKAGGAFCFLAGILGFYNAYAGMADATNSYFTVKPFFMPGAITPDSNEEDIERAAASVR